MKRMISINYERIIKKIRENKEAGDYDEAIKNCNLAIALKLKKEEKSEVLLLKGNLFKEMQSFEDAVECYDKVLEIDPKNKQAKKEMEKCVDGFVDEQIERRKKIKSKRILYKELGLTAIKIGAIIGFLFIAFGSILLLWGFEDLGDLVTLGQVYGPKESRLCALPLLIIIPVFLILANLWSIRRISFLKRLGKYHLCGYYCSIISLLLNFISPICFFLLLCAASYEPDYKYLTAIYSVGFILPPLIALLLLMLAFSLPIYGELEKNNIILSVFWTVIPSTLLFLYCIFSYLVTCTSLASLDLFTRFILLPFLILVMGIGIFTNGWIIYLFSKEVS
jgi:hypothetical protein